MLGLRELAIVSAVVLMLYGRTGMLRSRRFQAIWPWIAPVRRKPGSGSGLDADPSATTSTTTTAGKPRFFSLEGNRLFWFLTILAATAVATSIITRALIVHGGPPAPLP